MQKSRKILENCLEPCRRGLERGYIEWKAQLLRVEKGAATWLVSVTAESGKVFQTRPEIRERPILRSVDTWTGCA